MAVSGISILGRATQGVTLMRTAEGSRVVSIARVLKEDEADGEEEDIGDEPELAEDTDSTEE
jgi:DNA gyrase subunit A